MQEGISNSKEGRDALAGVSDPSVTYYVYKGLWASTTDPEFWDSHLPSRPCQVTDKEVEAEDQTARACLKAWAIENEGDFVIIVGGDYRLVTRGEVTA